LFLLQVNLSEYSSDFFVDLILEIPTLNEFVTKTIDLTNSLSCLISHFLLELDFVKLLELGDCLAKVVDFLR
jgi:hypothetical protein